MSKEQVLEKNGQTAIAVEKKRKISKSRTVRQFGMMCDDLEKIKYLSEEEVKTLKKIRDNVVGKYMQYVNGK